MSKLRRTAPPIGWEHVRNCFPMPNELFLFDLSANALAVYIYLLYCANRHTGQCHPSMPTMAKKLHLSRSTVLRCVKTLEEAGLIATEHTDIVTKRGIKRNGNLRYTILPIQFSIDQFYQRQLDAAEQVQERRRAARRMEQLTQKGGAEC